MNLREIIENAHMAGQGDAGVDPGYSNARGYCNKILNELKNYNEVNIIEKAYNFLVNSRRNHYFCDDTWYNCPKHEDGCNNDSVGDDCNCGADKYNALLDEILKDIEATFK